METLLKVVAVAGWMVFVGCEADSADSQWGQEPISSPVSEAPATDTSWYPVSQEVAVADSAWDDTASSSVDVAYANTGYQQTYVVRKGDTLWSIATRMYHNGQRWRDIQAVNPGIQPSKLRVGQEILLP